MCGAPQTPMAALIVGRLAELSLRGRRVDWGAWEFGGPEMSAVVSPLLSHLLLLCSFRAKYHKLKFGTDPNQGEKKPELSEQGTPPAPRTSLLAPLPKPPLLPLLHRKQLGGAGEGLTRSQGPSPQAALSGEGTGLDPWGEAGWVVVKKPSPARCPCVK